MGTGLTFAGQEREQWCGNGTGAGKIVAGTGLKSNSRAKHW